MKMDNSIFDLNDSSQQIISKLDDVITDDNRMAIDELLGLLSATKDGEVRNAVAIALADWQEERAVPVLLNLLQADKTTGNRGTLIYALQAFDCEPYLAQISQQLCSGNFEVKENTIQIFLDLPDQMSEDVINESLQILTNCPEQDKYVLHAIEILEEIAENS